MHVLIHQRVFLCQNHTSLMIVLTLFSQNDKGSDLNLLPLFGNVVHYCIILSHLVFSEQTLLTLHFHCDSAAGKILLLLFPSPLIYSDAVGLPG